MFKTQKCVRCAKLTHVLDIFHCLGFHKNIKNDAKMQHTCHFHNFCYVERYQKSEEGSDPKEYAGVRCVILLL
jgi:hypothetical protein